MRPSISTILPLLAAALLTCSGCGGGSQVSKLTVTATLDGKPLADADVMFQGKDDKTLGNASGKTAADGKVEIIMNKHMKMKAGRYVATVTKIVGVDSKKFEALAMPVAADLPAGGPKNVLHPKYSDANQSPLIVTVEPGAASVTLELKSKP